ncbi:MAG: hypothetical protein BWY86_00980 [Candidatus Aminicenantes bacterium ADurb.Bin508]|nr:MAG: hypothetical protein BWY86_00980 [Candidatus Aminicenantes bacterium ADurb.Bin508]
MTGSETPAGKEVRGTASPPKSFICQSWVPSFLVERKKIVFPSGDQKGENSLPSLKVT